MNHNVRDKPSDDGMEEAQEEGMKTETESEEKKRFFLKKDRHLFSHAY